MNGSNTTADINRRLFLAACGSAMAAGALACGSQSSSPSLTSPSASDTSPASTNAACVVTPALTEGPYFVDERLNRSDIRTDAATGIARAGVPLGLTFRLSQISSAGICAPLAGALIDVWHCDASGLYSDVAAQSTIGQKFLRGYQTTDAAGSAQFTTIYPGWYMGRAVHIHFKVRTNPAGSSGLEFTSQFFFDESLTDVVHAQAPYSAKGRRDTRNSSDGIYVLGGSQMLITLAPSGNGYAGSFGVSVRV